MCLPGGTGAALPVPCGGPTHSPAWRVVELVGPAQAEALRAQCVPAPVHSGTFLLEGVTPLDEALATNELAPHTAGPLASDGTLEARLAFIDNVAGQWALTKGYGKDPAVNGVLAAFWSTAALADWLPDFPPVPSKANVADAISRGGLAMARRMGWTRIHTPVPAILAILQSVVADVRSVGLPAQSGRRAGCRKRTRRRAALLWRRRRTRRDALLTIQKKGPFVVPFWSFVGSRACRESHSCE